MKTTEILKSLDKTPIFTAKQVQAMTGSSPAYSKQVLHRWKKRGMVYKIERGKYTTHKDPFLVASRIVWPSYISMWSALRYHNLTEQVPHSFWVVTTRARKNPELHALGTDIYFTSTKPEYFYGYRKIDRDGFEVFIADREKAIIDCLLFRKVSVSEIYAILQNNKKNIRFGKLIGYALKTKNTAMIKRLGYMLEKIGNDYHDRVEDMIYRPITRLEPNLPAKGPINKKWKILENVDL